MTNQTTPDRSDSLVKGGSPAERKFDELAHPDEPGWLIDDEDHEGPVEITSTNGRFPPREALLAAAEGSHNVGNPGINWERFYECLETEGWDMQALGSPVDSKIRRIVRKAIREGEVT